MNKITLPFPPKELSPNARLHLAEKAKVKKTYREECFYEAKLQNVKPMSNQLLMVRIVFFPPDKRKRDWANMLAAAKSGLDGLADAIKVDCSQWRISFEVSEKLWNSMTVSINYSGPQSCPKGELK